MDRRLTPAIALGGIAGAAARWWVHSIWPDGSEWWATVIVNVAGSAILGWLVAADLQSGRALATILGAGFCGSFTTFSTFSVILAEYLQAGRPGAGFLYAALTVGPAIATALGAGWMRRRLSRADRRAVL